MPTETPVAPEPTRPIAPVRDPMADLRRQNAPISLWRTPEAITSAISGLLLALGYLAQRAGSATWVPELLWTGALVAGGFFFVRRAIRELIQQRQIGTYFLMSLGGLAAWLIGHADEGAMLVFLTSISEAAQNFTERKTRSAITALMSLAPRTALVDRDGVESVVPVEALVVGDRFIVRPGEAIATDGVIETGFSEVDQAPVTGESVPVERGPGDTVFAGTINGPSALRVRATHTAADNTLARIISLVESAREHRGQSQRFIEQFGAIYSPAILVVAAAVACGPPLLGGLPWADWLNRATVFIVAAAPCAMVISIPVALVAAIGTGARQGVLIKGGVHLEELARVKVVALDKTGTLTAGRPAVTDVVSLGDRNADRATILALAAGIEAYSEHPLAAAIGRQARSEGLTPVPVTGFRALTGRGAQADAGDRPVFAGSPALFAEQGHPVDPAALAPYQEAGKTLVLVGDAAGALGLIALRDNLRPNARQAVADLRAEGIERVVMLTGDHARTAQAIAAEVGVDEVFAGLKPEDKVDRVRALRARYGDVAMVGDGVNDAPALAEANVGIAMGAAGTDVALETADVALMADDLEKLVTALRLAHRNRHIVRQNLTLATLVITGLALGAIAGLLPLPAAVLGHEISEFLVIGNGLRMLRTIPDRAHPA